MTRWSPPRLPASLAAIAADQTLWANPERPLPTLSAEDRAAARTALEVYAAAPKGSAPSKIAGHVGTAASVMAKRPLSDGEAELRLDVYEVALADIDEDILSAAFLEAVKTMTFFPTVAEIRQIAGRMPAPPRIVYAWRLRQLLRAQGEAQPDELVDPSELRALLDSAAQSVALNQAA